MVESRTVAHLACKVEAPQVRVGQFEGLGDSSESKARGRAGSGLKRIGFEEPLILNPRDPRTTEGATTMLGGPPVGGSRVSSLNVIHGDVVDRNPFWNVEVFSPEFEEGDHPPLIALVVEDVEAPLIATAALLRRLGYEVLTASCGEIAIYVIDGGFSPDVVILDLDMPGLNGPQTLSCFRALLPNMPVILTIDWVDEATHALVRAHAHVTLLPKPHGLKALKAHLQQVHLAICRS